MLLFIRWDAFWQSDNHDRMSVCRSSDYRSTVVKMAEKESSVVGTCRQLYKRRDL